MGAITKAINVKIGCIPENPIMLRWVNDKGMLDHWVFGVNQFYTLATSNGDLIRLNFTDYSTQKALTELLSKESVRSIKLQAFDLTTQQIDGMVGLIESNHIEMLVDLEDETWMKVRIADGDYKMYQSKVMIHNFEAKIDLPERLIQNF